MEIDISVIRAGGNFDNGTQISMPKPIKPPHGK
jgi:hypothetical protein